MTVTVVPDTLTVATLVLLEVALTAPSPTRVTAMVLDLVEPFRVMLVLFRDFWSVGDTKPIVINGKVGNFTFSNLTINPFILGFNHNSAKEGSKRIHWLIGKISRKMVGLCDDRYNSNSTNSGYFQMNTSNTNVGGWKDSYMRKTLLGNSNTPTSPLANSLMAALPSDLRVIGGPPPPPHGCSCGAVPIRHLAVTCFKIVVLSLGVFFIAICIAIVTLYFIVRQKEQVIAGAGNIPSCVAGGISHIVRVLGHGFHDGHHHSQGGGGDQPHGPGR